MYLIFMEHFLPDEDEDRLILPKDYLSVIYKSENSPANMFIVHPSHRYSGVFQVLGMGMRYQVNHHCPLTDSPPCKERTCLQCQYKHIEQQAMIQTMLKFSFVELLIHPTYSFTKLPHNYTYLNTSNLLRITILQRTLKNLNPAAL